MMTNNAKAGPSGLKRLSSSTSRKSLIIPNQELAEKVEIYQSTKLENFLDYSILLSNNISMARDQLANERNWLTWFRLSCTLIVLGFTVLISFRLPEPDGHSSNETELLSNRIVGYVFVAIGFACSFVGLGKYFKNQRLLVRQATYVEAGWGSYIMAIIIFFFACTVMILASINKTQSSLLSN